MRRMEEGRVTCQVCLSILKTGDLICSSCGSAVPDHTVARLRAPAREAWAPRLPTQIPYSSLRRPARSADLISDLGPGEAISRLGPALVAMRTAASGAPYSLPELLAEITPYGIPN